MAEKIFFFNKRYMPEEREVNEHFEKEKRTYQKKFNEAILLQMEYLLQSDAFLLAELKKLETKAYLYNLERLERKHQEDVINEVAIQQNIKVLNDEIKRLQQLLAERDRLSFELADLLEKRANLAKLISRNKQDIIIIRKDLISNIISRSENLTINGKRFFDGVTHNNIIKFANGYDALLAMKAKQYAKAEEAKASALENLTNHTSSATTSAFDLDKKRVKINRELIEAKEGIDQDFDINLRRLADQTGLKAAALSEPEFKDVMSKFYADMDCDKTFNLLFEKYCDINSDQKAYKETVNDCIQTASSMSDVINEMNFYLDDSNDFDDNVSINVEQDFEGLDFGNSEPSSPVDGNPISLDSCDSMYELDFSGEFVSVKKTDAPPKEKGPGSKNGNR